MGMNFKGMEHGIEILLASMGIDYENDENFKGTPYRVAKLYGEMCQGLGGESYQKIQDTLKLTFPIDAMNDQLVLIENHICWSLCPHHLLPIRYRVDVAYITKERALGLSKLPRIITLIAQKPMLQEDFTQEIISSLDEGVDPLGSIVFVRGDHLCMRARGVRSTEAVTKTTALSGVFRVDPSAKEEFYRMLELA